jgi:putative hydrolase of the HAD superfamily
MDFSTIFFDLDDTIYPSSSGLWGAIGERINRYMIEKVHLAPEGIVELREHLFHTYGTSLRGLVQEYGVDAADYLAYVHDIPLRQYLQRDEALREALLGLKQRLVILTNADRNHASRVLKVIGIDDLFAQIIDIVAISPYCKPQVEAFQKAMALAGVADPAQIVFFDDNVPNLQVGRQLGFYTVRVGKKMEGDQPEYHASIAKLSDLGRVFNHNGKGKPNE